MTLYRKYRPQTIEELDLDSVRDTFKKISLNLATLPHAFLFSGPRGSGKTSAARILAKLANCESPIKKKDSIEPCNKCDQCLAITNGQSMDVIEMDAASNRGIDDIRSLREHIALSPASAKKKIYILDEAHMLTSEASNAFLKTLEEPPMHAIFILATTDPHKLPETVRSRLTTVSFRKATDKEITRQLERVAKSEKIKLEDGVFALIAKHSDGSFRDAVKILESLLAYGGEVSLSNATDYLFHTSVLSETELIDFLMKGEKEKLLKLIDDFSDKGGSIKDLIDRSLEELRSLMLVAVESQNPTDKIIDLIKLFLEARSNMSKTNIDRLPLEILIINFCSSTGKKKVAKSTNTFDGDTWNAILGSLREKNTSIETLLRAAKPLDMTDGVLNVEVYYQFHKERLESSQVRLILEKLIGEIVGKDVKVVYTLGNPPTSLKRSVGSDIQKTTGLTSGEEKDIIDAAKEIFGG